MPLAAHAAISSTPDDPTWSVGLGSVEAIVPDGDRAWIAGGFVNTAPRTGPGVELDTAGSVVPGLPELTGATGALEVDAVAADGSGGWYVAGSFTHAGGTAAAGLIHIRSDKTLDPAFNAQATPGTITALALSGGVLYAGGSFTSIGGQARTGLAALDPTTGAATAWNPALSAGGAVDAISIQGGFAWVGGGFTSVGATPVTNAAKVPLASNNADATWLPNPNTAVHAILATATNVYLGGTFTTVNGGAFPYLAKTDQTNGTPDPGWLPNPSTWVDGLASDGTNLYAVGRFTTINGVGHKGAAAIPLDNSTAGAALAWDPGSLSNASAVAVAGGVVYMGGAFARSLGNLRGGLAAAQIVAKDPTGTLLASWQPETTDNVLALATDAAGSSIYAGGKFAGVGAQQVDDLMPIDLTTGQPMAFFNHTFDGPIYGATVCNGIVYVVGQFFTIDGATQRWNAAAFDRNTGQLTPWNPDLDNDAYSVACGAGVVYIGGQFQFLKDSTVTPITRNGLAATDPNTGDPTAWDPGGPGPTSVRALAVNGSTVYAGGSFTSLGSPAVARTNLAALDATTGAATGWAPAPAQPVMGFAFSGSTVYVAEGVGGVAHSGQLAEFDLSTGAATGFNLPADDIVTSVVRASDGTLYVGGWFTTLAGQPRPALAAANANGTLTSWNPQASGAAPTVFGLALGGDGRLYAGGSFQGMIDRGLYGLATFSEPTSFATQPSLSTAPVAGTATTCNTGTPGGSLPAPTTVQWLVDGAAVSGATASSYTPTSSDVGHLLSCRVSQRNLISSVQADSPQATVSAAPVSPAAAPPPPAPFDIDGFKTPPPPQRGKSVIATPTSGVVLVLLPGAKTYIPLPDAERIPVGTIIDARHGTVRLTSVGKNGKLQSAIFYAGIFQVFQGTGKNAVTELRLFGGNFAVCKKAKTAAGALAAGRIPKSKSIRHLWGSGKGLFRTKGRYASATIRGTKWLTDDRCDGTLIRVAKGAVTVRDIPKRKTFALKAPKQYLARV